jgi:hypothetical protein
MRIEAEPFDYRVPAWRPYDADRLRGLGAPAAAVAALAGRGLPDDLHEQFVRVPERELELADLPECGTAAFLGQVWDGFNNTIWLGLGDGSIWMRYGGQDEPVDQMKRINTSVETLQSMLTVLDAYWRVESRHLDIDAREDLINQTVIHAVAADPEVFEDGENWWSMVFQEIEFSSAQIRLGDALALCDLVSRDESGSWGLDHPGFEEDPTLRGG